MDRLEKRSEAAVGSRWNKHLRDDKIKAKNFGSKISKDPIKSLKINEDSEIRASVISEDPQIERLTFTEDLPKHDNVDMKQSDAEQEEEKVDQNLNPKDYSKLTKTSVYTKEEDEALKSIVE